MKLHGTSRGLMILCFLGVFTPLTAQVEVDEFFRFKGNFGARVSLPSPAPSGAFLVDGNSESETRYVAQFYVHTTNLSLQVGDALTLLRAFDAGSNSQFRVMVENNGGQRQLQIEARQDNGSFTQLAPGDQTNLGDGWHAVQVEWTAAAGTGAMRLFLDGAEVTGLSNLDNDQGAVGSIRFGVETPPSQGAGEILLDNFDSRRDTRISILCITDTEYNSFFPDFPGVSVRRMLEHDAHRCQAGTVLPEGF